MRPWEPYGKYPPEKHFLQRTAEAAEEQLRLTREIAEKMDRSTSGTCNSCGSAFMHKPECRWYR